MDACGDQAAAAVTNLAACLEEPSRKCGTIGKVMPLVWVPTPRQ